MDKLLMTAQVYSKLCNFHACTMYLYTDGVKAQLLNLEEISF